MRVSARKRRVGRAEACLWKVLAEAVDDGEHDFEVLKTICDVDVRRIRKPNFSSMLTSNYPQFFLRRNGRPNYQGMHQ